MDRKQFVNRYFQKKDQLLVAQAAYASELNELFFWMARADAVKNDITSKHLSLNKTGNAQIKAKQDGILCGLEEVLYLLKKNTKLLANAKIKDGFKIKKGEVFLELTGTNYDLLSFERIILNILGRMSGIATYTNLFLQKIAKVKNIPLLVPTRKTSWMLLDKKAVVVGGGGTHRLSLSDFVLIKDNHLLALQKELNIDFEEALQEAVKRVLEHEEFFEIEVVSISQAKIVLSAFENFAQKRHTMAILLDNFLPQEATQFALFLQKNALYGRVLVEASGEITKDNLSLWAETGVDILSAGRLTHSASNFNLSMDM